MKNWRTLVPASLFVLVTVLIARLKYPLPESADLLLWLSRLDPLLMLSRLRLDGEVLAWFWLPLAVILLTLWMGRVFCGWLCPLGGLLALIQSALSHLYKSPFSFKLTAFLRTGRYYWLVFILFLILFGTNWPLLLTPYTLLSHEAAKVWLGQAPWLLFAILALGLLFFPRFWCVYLCPTGLFLSAVARFRQRRFIIQKHCKKCGLCVAACPTKAVNPAVNTINESCILCARCWENCPPDSVVWGGTGVTGAQETRDYLQTRRNFIKAAAFAIAAFAAWPFLTRSANAVMILRPPGAVPEEDFIALCSRCGRCIKVCPNQALQPMPIAYGLAAFETPRFIPRSGRCELCLLCQEVCPTGAVSSVPVEQIKIGTAELDRRRCLVWSEGIECLICAEQCPFQAVRLDAHGRPHVLADRCIGCGACENGCPVEEAAIRVLPVSNNMAAYINTRLRSNL